LTIGAFDIFVISPIVVGVGVGVGIIVVVVVVIAGQRML
jgi:hypothetical protein